MSGSDGRARPMPPAWGAAARTALPRSAAGIGATDRTDPSDRTRPGRSKPLETTTMITLKVEGMTCMGCVRSVEKAVGRADPGARVEIDLPSGKVAIESATPRETFVAAIEDAGYDVAA